MKAKTIVKFQEKKHTESTSANLIHARVAQTFSAPSALSI